MSPVCSPLSWLTPGRQKSIPSPDMDLDNQPEGVLGKSALSPCSVRDLTHPHSLPPNAAPSKSSASSPHTSSQPTSTALAQPCHSPATPYATRYSQRSTERSSVSPPSGTGSLIAHLGVMNLMYRGARTLGPREQRYLDKMMPPWLRLRRSAGLEWVE
jgi:hypothetical protein